MEIKLWLGKMKLVTLKIIVLLKDLPLCGYSRYFNGVQHINVFGILHTNGNGKRGMRIE